MRPVLVSSSLPRSKSAPICALLHWLSACSWSHATMTREDHFHRVSQPHCPFGRGRCSASVPCIDPPSEVGWCCTTRPTRRSLRHRLATRSSRIAASVTVQLTNFNAREILFRDLCRSAREVGATNIAAFRPPSEESGRVDSGSSSWLSPVLAARVMRGEIGAEEVLPRIAGQKFHALQVGRGPVGNSNEIRLLDQSHPILCNEGRASNRGVYCLAGHLPELRVSWISLSCPLRRMVR